MTAKIGKIGDGGVGLSDGQRNGDEATLQELLLAVRSELDDIRTKYAALLAKLNADAGVTDTNYVALLSLSTATFEA